MEKIKETVRVSGMVLFGIFWSLGWPITFSYLIIQDYNSHPSFFSWPILIALDAFIATIWPLYWLILHWVPLL